MLNNSFSTPSVSSGIKITTLNFAKTYFTASETQLQFEVAWLHNKVPN